VPLLACPAVLFISRSKAHWYDVPPTGRFSGKGRNPRFFRMLWTPDPAPDCDPGFAGVTVRNTIPYFGNGPTTKGPAQNKCYNSCTVAPSLKSGTVIPAQAGIQVKKMIGVGTAGCPAAPPSEPYVRISRIRLSSWWFTPEGTD
jgi:hypothetical protein